MIRKGFTFIELLIVIAVLGILAVAVLSAINPVEQLRKARDAGRKSDSAELLNAYERYFTTWGCYPWEHTGAVCDTTQTMATVNPALAAAGDNSYELIAREEVKPQFATRSTIANNEMFVTEAASGQVSVCFTPESNSARAGGLGPIKNQANTAVGSCAGAYAPGQATCNVCVPQ